MTFFGQKIEHGGVLYGVRTYRRTRARLGRPPALGEFVAAKAEQLRYQFLVPSLVTHPNVR